MIQSTQRKMLRLSMQKKGKIEKKKRKTTEALEMKLQMETAQTQITIKTATSL